MEYFDILDSDGNPTGLIGEKGAELNRDQYYLGIHAYIFNSENKFLIQQRSYNKSFLPGGWDVHLGHVVSGESSVECMIREVREEIGLCVNPDDIYSMKRLIWEENSHHISDVYFINMEYQISETVLKEDEVIAVKEVSADEMTGMVKDMYYRSDVYKNFIISEIERILQR